MSFWANYMLYVCYTKINQTFIQTRTKFFDIRHQVHNRVFLAVCCSKSLVSSHVNRLKRFKWKKNHFQSPIEPIGYDHFDALLLFWEVPLHLERFNEMCISLDIVTLALFASFQLKYGKNWAKSSKNKGPSDLASLLKVNVKSTFFRYFTPNLNGI